MEHIDHFLTEEEVEAFYEEEDATLRGGQPRALGLRKGLLHVIQQDVQALIEIRYRAALLCQAVVALGDDSSDCAMDS